eukprot:jgi/Mesen1/9082/ME000579S08458
MQRARLVARLASRLRQAAAAPQAQVLVSQKATVPAVISELPSFEVLSCRNTHTSCRAHAQAAALEVTSDSEGILFPREGPGVSYALNWALASIGVTPAGEAHRNFKPAALKKLGGSSPGAKNGSKVYAKGAHSTGAEPITKAQFNKLFKEVTAHLSGVPKLYVHDGAVSSAPGIDARTRTVSDSPSGALVLGSILTSTPTRVISSDAFPLTVYVASGYRHGTDPLPLATFSECREGFVAVDYDTSAVIVVGGALGDTAAIKSALTAAAGPIIAAAGGASALVLAPDSAAASLKGLSQSALLADTAAVLGPSGVARLFQGKDEGVAPNVYKAPAALVIVTSDSTGAVPAICKLSPAQAAYYYLAGYDGKKFKPAYASGPLGVEPVALALKLADLVTSHGIPAYLVNAHEGDKLVSDKELDGLVAAAVSGKLPKSKSKKPAESAATALGSKIEEFIKSKFGDLPDGIAA